MLPHSFPTTFGSKNEQNVYYALTRYEIDFDYQVPIFGGRLQRGGLVLDFLVRNPFDIAVPVGKGGYWHRSYMSSEEQYALGVLIERFQGRVVALTEEETDTYEEAEDAVRTWIVERPGASKY